MIRRIGQFFFLVGLLLLALFFLSDVAQMTQYELLLYALGAFLVYWLTRRSRKKREESGRFRTVRKMMGGGKKGEKGEE